MIKKKMQAQILVIVVIVIFVLSIIVIGMISVVTRDVEQSLSSSQYELSLHYSEEKLLSLVEDYSDRSIPLSKIESIQECDQQSDSKYSCVYSNEEITTMVNVQEKNSVENYELGKDQSINIILNNYRGKVEVSWTGKFALDFILQYQDGNYEYKNIRDVADPQDLIFTGIINRPLGVTVPTQGVNYAVIDLGGINGIAANDYLLSLKVKALSKDESVTLLSLNGTDSFPMQIREFEAISYFGSGDANNSVPTMTSQIPLGGEEIGILDYVLRSNEVVTK